MVILKNVPFCAFVVLVFTLLGFLLLFTLYEVLHILRLCTRPRKTLFLQMSSGRDSIKLLKTEECLIR